MESSGMSGSGMIPNISRGVLGLEMPLHQSQPPQQPPPHLRHPPQPQQLLPFPANLTQTHHDATSDLHPSLKQGAAGGGVFMKSSSKPPPQQQPIAQLQQGMPLSPDNDDDGGGRPPPAAASPWQRMKWTDTMVRLLIMVVFYVGDEGGVGGDHTSDSTSSVGKAKKAGTATSVQQQQQQQQQKKGKWKSVSRAMMERGYNVSPQQCEDKFNDLNKRYKRVNDILGRGTACRVVENQALLDSMDHLSPKAKEEARKLLNSKHLFFREMCAYHSSCAAAAAQAPAQHALGQPQQCVHPVVQDSAGGFRVRGETPTTSLKLTHKPAAEDHDEHHHLQTMEGKTVEEEEAHEDDEDEEDESDDDDVDDDDEDDDHHHRQHGVRRRRQEEEEESKGLFMTANSTSSGSKRQRVAVSASPPGTPPPSREQQQLRAELVGLSGTGEQRREWVRRRAVELEEKRVDYQRRALELERQRFKWLRFSRNKEREMEQAKLENERLRLESDRMLLMLRHKELELMCGEQPHQYAHQPMGMFRQPPPGDS